MFRISLPFWLTFFIFTFLEVPVSLVQGRSYAWSGFEGWFFTLLAIAAGSTLLVFLVKVIFESSFVITEGAIIHDSRIFHVQLSREKLKVKVDGGLRGLLEFYRGSSRTVLPDIVDLNSAGLSRFIFLETLYRKGVPIEGPGFTLGKKSGLEHGVLYERVIGGMLVLAGIPLALERVPNAAMLTAIGAGFISLGFLMLDGSRRSRGLVSGLDAESMPGMPSLGTEYSQQKSSSLILETEPSLLWGSRIRLVLQGSYGRKSPLTHFRPFLTGRMLRLIAEARARQMPILIDSHQGLSLHPGPEILPESLSEADNLKIRLDLNSETKTDDEKFNA